MIAGFARRAVLLVPLLLPLAARTAEPALEAGNGRTTRGFALEELARLPAVAVEVSLATGHGRVEARFSGPLLWTVLAEAGLVGDGDARRRPRQTVTVTGRDGYSAVLALAEIAPDYEGKQVILAMPSAPSAEAGALRLVVPGDGRAGRAVRDVVRVRLD